MKQRLSWPVGMLLLPFLLIAFWAVALFTLLTGTLAMIGGALLGNVTLTLKR
jgi:hypothetical protein